jgi:hypothetical protein
MRNEAAATLSFSMSGAVRGDVFPVGPVSSLPLKVCPDDFPRAQAFPQLDFRSPEVRHGAGTLLKLSVYRP